MQMFDVDARLLVDELGHDARNDRHAHLVEHVGDSIDDDRKEARIGHDDLLAARRGGIALIERLDVLQEQRVDARNRREKVVRHAVRSELAFRPRGPGRWMKEGVLIKNKPTGQKPARENSVTRKEEKKEGLLQARGLAREYGSLPYRHSSVSL